MLSAGQRIDRYTVEGLVGEGGMAEVYRVRHATLGSPHALKLLKVQGASIRARLLAEGRAQATLRHPNIVAVTDVVEVDGAPALILDYVEGPTLEAWLAERRPALREAERLFLGILAGVERAHRAGLVHRDLKPGNVLLASGEDGTLVPRVTDFGLSKVIFETDNALTRTRSGVAMGTPQYMAPEQVRSAADADQRADVWSLGCILYDLVSGARAFDGGDDVYETFSLVTAGRYTPIEQLAPAVPARIRRAIDGSLVVDRERRIQSCAALRQVLGEEGQVRRWSAVRTPAPAPSLGSELVEIAPSAGTWAVDEDDEALDVDPPVGEGTLGLTEEEELKELPSRPPAATVASIVLAPAPDPWATQEHDLRRSARWTWGLVAAGLAGLGMLTVLAIGGAWWATRRSAEDETSREPAVAVDVAASPTAAPASALAPAVDAVTSTSAAQAEPVAAPPPAPAPSPAPDAARSARPRSTRVAASSTVPAKVATAAGAATEAAPTASSARSVQTGTVRVTGDAERVELVAPSGRVSPGTVPAGAYEIRAVFAGRPEVLAGRVTVPAGGEVRIRCLADFQACKVEAP